MNKMLIKIGKWHLVFIKKIDDKLWSEKWFSLFPFRFNENYTAQMKKRLGLAYKHGTVYGESIFLPQFNKNEGE